MGTLIKTFDDSVYTHARRITRVKNVLVKTDCLNNRARITALHFWIMGHTSWLTVLWHYTQIGSIAHRVRAPMKRLSALMRRLHESFTSPEAWFLTLQSCLRQLRRLCYATVNTAINCCKTLTTNRLQLSGCCTDQQRPNTRKRSAPVKIF